MFKKIRNIISFVLLILIILSVFRMYVFGSFEIPSASMENTLKIGDKVLVSKVAPSPVAKLHRGDIIVFHDPGGWLTDSPRPTGWHLFLLTLGIKTTETDDLEFLIKRVIGLPGDHIFCEENCKNLTINGKEVIEDQYLMETKKPASYEPIDVTVPENMVYVLGDNRSNSADSRFNEETTYKGFVPMGNIVGTAKIVFSPMNHFKTLKIPSNVFKDVPSPN